MIPIKEDIKQHFNLWFYKKLWYYIKLRILSFKIFYEIKFYLLLKKHFKFYVYYYSVHKDLSSISCSVYQNTYFSVVITLMCNKLKKYILNLVLSYYFIWTTNVEYHWIILFLHTGKTETNYHYHSRGKG